MLKPKKGSLLIRKVKAEEFLQSKSGIITEVRTEKARVNPWLIKATVEAANIDSEAVKVGDTVLAQFVALTPIEDELYVIPLDYIEAVIDPDADIQV